METIIDMQQQVYNSLSNLCRSYDLLGDKKNAKRIKKLQKDSLDMINKMEKFILLQERKS